MRILFCMVTSAWLRRAVYVVGLLPAICFAQIGTNLPRAGDIPAQLKLAKIIQGPPLNEVSWATLKGKVVVLEFWNTGCVPCIEAIPHLNDLVEHFRDKPVVFLSVSDDAEERLSTFLREHPMKSWIALDGTNNATERAFHLKGYGLIVLIDAKGRVAGFTLPALLEQKHLDRILAGQSAGLPILKFTSPAE